MKARTPPAVRHLWFRRDKGEAVYVCTACRSWTANLPLYRYDVCEARDRRKQPDRRAKEQP